MSTAALLTVLGLSCDLVGAFLLGVDAIGVKRIGTWRERIVEYRRAFTAPRAGTLASRSKAKRAVWFPRFFFGSCVGLGAWIGGRTALSFEPWGEGSWDRWGPGVVGVVIGGILAGGFVDFGITLLGLTIAILHKVEMSAGRGSVGASGFGFLAVGFALQIFGALARH